MNPVLVKSPAGCLKIWDHPSDNAGYVIGADVAEGKQRDVSHLKKGKSYSYASDRPDYSAAVVLEMKTGMHVATWHGYLSPDEFSLVLASLGMYYNDAFMVVELNGPGLAVVTRLTESMRYENMYRARLLNVYTMQDPSAQPIGWQTNKFNRHILIDHISEAINHGNLFTRDRALISEIRTMEIDPATGTPRARGKNKDDRVFALALALEGRYMSMGYGFSSPEAENRKLAGYDKAVWDRVRQQQEAHAGNRDSVGSSSRSWIDRPSRPLG